MQKIIDAGSMRSMELSKFLDAASNNRAVLCDYAMMESFKGTGDTNVRRSLDILSRYVDRVDILKPTGHISAMAPSFVDMPMSLVDIRHTSSFARYCVELYSGQDRGIRNDVFLKQARANAHFERLTTATEIIRKAITKIQSTYTPEELKILRKGDGMTFEIAQHIVRDVMLNAQALYTEQRFSPLPSLENAIYGFPFRFALTGYGVAIWWIKAGGHQTVAAHRLRNDLTDAVYAAYATFFDGILTKDKKLGEVYVFAKTVLSTAFDF